MGIRYFLFLRSILSGRRPMSYRNQSIDLQSKSIDWFLYDKDLRLERVSSPSICYFPRFLKMVISNIPAITLGLHTSKTGFSCLRVFSSSSDKYKFTDFYKTFRPYGRIDPHYCKREILAIYNGSCRINGLARENHTWKSLFSYYLSQPFWSLTLPTRCISESYIKIKNNLNFYFHTFLWCLKMFYEGF